MKIIGQAVRVLTSVPPWAPAGYLGTDEDCVVVSRVKDRLLIRRASDDGARWYVDREDVQFCLTA